MCIGFFGGKLNVPLDVEAQGFCVL